MSEDGMLDILQITVQLEAAASEAWKPMIRETILSCNDVISASKSQYSSLSLYFWFLSLKSPTLSCRNFGREHKNTAHSFGSKLQRSTLGDAQVPQESTFHGW
jgi:hypothetical protein